VTHPGGGPNPGPRLGLRSGKAAFISGFPAVGSTRPAHPVQVVGQAAAPPKTKSPAAPVAAITHSANPGVHVRPMHASTQALAEAPENATVAAPAATVQPLVLLLVSLAALDLALIWARRRNNRRLNAQART
jgi:hypothetical protein